MKKILLLLLLASTCGCFTDHSIRSDFNETFKEYNILVRWHELDKAYGLYGSQEFKEQLRERPQADKNLNVVDYRVVSSHYDPEKLEATATVEIDYHLHSSNVVKTVKDQQKWEYREEGKKKGWRLTSPPPPFK